ncbi:MAG: serine hydrolase domain-containing protein [Blastocatellia bacterium]
MKLQQAIRIVIVVTLCLWTASAQSPAQTRLSEARRNFDQFYQESLAKSGIVGSSFMLLCDNQVIDRQFYGLSNLEQKIPTDEDTIYHWASITKTFTGIAIMQLRDRGLLSLDDPIIKYVPELRVVHNPFGPMEQITIRHLISHMAGFRAATWPWGGNQAWQPAEPPGWAQLVAMMPYTEIEFAPGSKYSYSNPGIVFLGRVIEVLMKEDYEVYIDKNIFKPLEMYHSYFDTTPSYLLRHRSHSYRLKDGKLTPGRFDMDTGVTVSNGGLNAPLTDLVKYLNFLMGDPKKQELYDQVLKRSSLLEMWQPKADVPEDDKGRNRKDFVGMAFFIEDNFGMRFICHSGHQNNFATHFYLNPELRAAYVIAFNTYAPPKQANPAHDTDLLDRRIKEYLFENIFPLFRK